MKALRTAIFGTGFMGRVHLEGVRRVESVEASAIVGRDAEKAQRLGGGFSIPTITTDYKEVLHDKAIDAVHICTPNSQHFSMAKDALLAGKHVLCEKVRKLRNRIARPRQRALHAHGRYDNTPL